MTKCKQCGKPLSHWLYQFCSDWCRSVYYSLRASINGSSAGESR